MKTRLSFLLSLMTLFTLSAQVQWRGGFPGHETDWACARNWSDGRIPDDMDNVIIPDCSARGNFYPLIRTETARVQSMEIHGNARVSIAENGKLTVLGYGIPGGALLNQGLLENKGTLEVIEPVIHALKYTGPGTLIHRRSDLKPDECTFQCSLN